MAGHRIAGHEKRGRNGPFYVIGYALTGSGEGMYQFAETRNFTAGGRFVNHALAGGFVDERDSTAESRAGGFTVANGYGFANLFDVGAHRRANVGITSIANFVLAISLES